MPYRFLFPETSKTAWGRIFHAFVLTSVEAFLGLICLLAGIPVLLDPSTFAPMVVLKLGEWISYPWAIGMLTGGALTLGGIAKGEFRVEQMGVAILGFVATLFCIALVGAWPVSWVALLSYLSFALAMVARYWVLGKLARRHAAYQERLALILDKDGEQ